MRKVCTKTIDHSRPVCGMGVPTQAAPYCTRRDLPTLTLTTSRPVCRKLVPTQAAPQYIASRPPTLTLTTSRPAGEIAALSRGLGLRPHSFAACAAASGFLAALGSSWPLRGARAIVAGPGRLGSPPSLFAFLVCVLRASGCLPALELGVYRFGLPVSRPLSQARSLAGGESSAPAGLPSPAPSPAAAFWVGRVGFPPYRSARSARPLALLPRHSGLPLRGCFCPASRGWLVFSLPSPSRVLASLRLRPSVRAENPRFLAPLLVCVPSPPI